MNPCECDRDGRPWLVYSPPGGCGPGIKSRQTEDDFAEKARNTKLEGSSPESLDQAVCAVGYLFIANRPCLERAKRSKAIEGISHPDKPLFPAHWHR